MLFAGQIYDTIELNPRIKSWQIVKNIKRMSHKIILTTENTEEAQRTQS